MTEYNVTAFSSLPGSLIRAGYSYARNYAAAHRAVRDLSPADADDPPTVWVCLKAAAAHWVAPTYWEGGPAATGTGYDLRRITKADYEYAYARLNRGPE